MKTLLSIVVLLVFVAGGALGRTLFYKPGSQAEKEMIAREKRNQYLTRWNLPLTKNPKFCNNLDCPKFTVLNKTKDYEIRRYAAAGWVSTDLAGISYEDATYPMFNKLFQYISGKNSKGKKIAMTAPVTIHVIPGQGPACEQNFTMSFFVSGNIKAAPKPTDKTVYLRVAKPMTVYVRSFPGFAEDYKTWRAQAIALGKAINDPTKFDQKYYYTAGYNSPFQLFNRHNEVWFIQK